MLIPLKDRNPTRTFPYVTILLIVVNIYVFFLQSPFGKERVAVNLWYRFGFIPGLFTTQFNEEEYSKAWQRLKQDFMLRPLDSQSFPAKVQELRERAGLYQDLDEIQRSGKRLELLTLLTSLFLHGSLWHVLSNMLFLWVFGNNIEEAAGHAKFLLFYLLCGALASFGQMLINVRSLVPNIGASGSISGVMGAYLILYPTAKIVTIIPFFHFLWYPIELPAFVYLGYWILIQIVLAQLSLAALGEGGIAWFAHVGGFFAGILLIFIFRKRHLTPAHALPDE